MGGSGKGVQEDLEVGESEYSERHALSESGPSVCRSIPDTWRRKDNPGTV